MDEFQSIMFVAALVCVIPTLWALLLDLTGNEPKTWPVLPQAKWEDFK